MHMAKQKGKTRKKMVIFATPMWKRRTKTRSPMQNRFIPKQISPGAVKAAPGLIDVQTGKKGYFAVPFPHWNFIPVRKLKGRLM